MPHIIMAPNDFADSTDQQPTLGCFSTEGKAQYARESWISAYADLTCTDPYHELEFEIREVNAVPEGMHIDELCPVDCMWFLGEMCEPGVEWNEDPSFY